MDNYLILGLSVTIIGGIVVGLVLRYVFGIGKQGKKGDKYDKSPSIKSGGDVRAGRDIVVGNRETIVHQTSAQEVPELDFHLDARPVKPVKASIEKKSEATLVVISVEIAGVVTEVKNGRFTKLLPLDNLNFPQSLFETKSDGIKVKVRYRTLAGETYEYSQGAVQESRDDKRFNVVLQGNPTIVPVSNLSKEQKDIINEALKKDEQVYRMQTNETGDWVRAGGKDFFFESDNQKTRVYVDALEELVSQGYIEHKSKSLYVLTSKASDL